MSMTLTVVHVHQATIMRITKCLTIVLSESLGENFDFNSLQFNRSDNQGYPGFVNREDNVAAFTTA